MPSRYEEGNPQTAKICLVGEAPSNEEIRRDRPFVGPSGRLLDSLLQAAGLRRAELYLTNAFEDALTKRGKEFTIRGSYDPVMDNHGFTPYGMKLLEEGLFKRLATFGGNVIVPVGGVSLQALTEHKEIMKWRGSILPTVVGKKCVPTVHPAAVLRGQPLWKYYIHRDLKRAKEESSSAELNLPERQLHIQPNYGEAMSYLASLLNEDTVAFDIEVGKGELSCIGFSHDPAYAMCIPFTGPEVRWSVVQERDLMVAIATVLGSHEVRKVNQNILFDMQFLLNKYGIHTRGEVECHMCAHSIMFPDFPMGLDFQCSWWTREPYYKDEGKQWKKAIKNWPEWWRYNCKDAAVSLEIWQVLEPMLHDEGFWDQYRETMEMFPALMFMQSHGVKVDHERLVIEKERAEKELAALRAELISVADYEINPNSPKQLMKYFYEHKKITPYVNRKTGQPTVDDTALQRIINRYHLPEAMLIQKIRRLGKLVGTYMDVTLDEDARVRCSYNPRGTTTGRLSSSQTIFGTGMNLQNVHPQFRSFLVSDQ